jgi:hypothetical protein
MNYEYMNHTQNNPKTLTGDFNGCDMMPTDLSMTSMPSASAQIPSAMSFIPSAQIPALPMPIPITYAKSPVGLGPANMSDGGLSRQGPPPVMNPEYIPGFLVSNIGKLVRAEFVIGTTQYIDKTGILMEVGVNFFVLQDIASQARIMCDLYSVRFVNVLN